VLLNSDTLYDVDSSSVALGPDLTMSDAATTMTVIKEHALHDTGPTCTTTEHERDTVTRTHVTEEH